jgi:hypothetical protein
VPYGTDLACAESVSGTTAITPPVDKIVVRC